MMQIEKVINYRKMEIASTAFENHGMIPVKYTCDGENISPPLDIKFIPENAKCLALIMDDPDAPIGTWVHWTTWNIPLTHHIKEDEVHGVQGINDFQQCHYGGPCPPSGTHRYFFKVYALNNLLDLPADSKKDELEKVMSGHIVGFGEMVGRYKRKK